MNLATRPQGFSSLTPDNGAPLSPQLWASAVVAHVTRILTCEALPMHSSPTGYPTALPCHSKCTVHHMFAEPLMLFTEFPDTSLRKAVGALSLYPTFYSP